MNALDLLSDDEDDAPANESTEATEATEPDKKRLKPAQLDFKDLQRLGYSAGGEEDEKSKMENAFSSLGKVAMNNKTGVTTEIPGFATTYQIVKEGDQVTVPGAKEVSKGNQVTVHATGVMTKSGKTFWESRETQSGKPHVFIAGSGKKVVGWEQGCLGMRIGEVRKLSVPSHEGYGARGEPEMEIPPNCDLQFTVECLDIIVVKAPVSTMIWRYPSSSTSTSYQP